VLAVTALVLLVAFDLPDLVIACTIPLLAAAVLSAVEHADVIGHRTGEPYGSLVLAVAVTVIEVGLIVALMSSGGDAASTLPRDTVFAAVMICTAGIVGASMVIGAPPNGFTTFNPEGCRAGLATIATIATLSLVLPSYTESRPGPEFSPFQLGFAAVASLALWGMFVLTQTVRHRRFFLDEDHPEEHADPLQRYDDSAPSSSEALRSVLLLLVALLGVVGLAKVQSKLMEDAVSAAGLPHAVVGVVIALVVLLPEGLTALRAARRGSQQTAFNLAYGSAIASIGLTIPVLAALSPWIPVPLELGLEPRHVVLLALTIIISILTIVPGRATRLQGGVHLVVLLAFIALSINP
jgi:Ca2+:H+ antiporter